MSALVVDTSGWVTSFAQRGPSVIDEALAEGRVYLSPVVAAELLPFSPGVGTGFGWFRRVGD